MFYFQKIGGKQVLERLGNKEELKKLVNVYFDQLTLKHGQQYAADFFKTMECIQGE